MGLCGSVPEERPAAKSSGAAAAAAAAPPAKDPVTALVEDLSSSLRRRRFRESVQLVARLERLDDAEKMPSPWALTCALAEAVTAPETERAPVLLRRRVARQLHRFVLESLAAIFVKRLRVPMGEKGHWVNRLKALLQSLESSSAPGAAGLCFECEFASAAIAALPVGEPVPAESSQLANMAFAITHSDAKVERAATFDAVFNAGKESLDALRKRGWLHVALGIELAFAFSPATAWPLVLQLSQPYQGADWRERGACIDCMEALVAQATPLREFGNAVVKFLSPFGGVGDGAQPERTREMAVEAMRRLQVLWEPRAGEADVEKRLRFLASQLEQLQLVESHAPVVEMLAHPAFLDDLRFAHGLPRPRVLSAFELAAKAVDDGRKREMETDWLLAQGLDTYQPLDVVPEAAAPAPAAVQQEAARSLDDVAERFLSEGCPRAPLAGEKYGLAAGRRSLLLLGASGAGKTLYMRHLEQKMWERFWDHAKRPEPEQDDESKEVKAPHGAAGQQQAQAEEVPPIPVYVPLGRPDWDPRIAITAVLKSRGVSEEQVAELRRKRAAMVLLLDGLDELPRALRLRDAPGALWNELDPDAWNARCVWTCRTSRLSGERALALLAREQSPQRIDAYVLLPLSFAAVFEVEDKFSRLAVRARFGLQHAWVAERFDEALTVLGLKHALAQNPGTLAIALHVVQRLSQAQANVQLAGEAAMTRGDLYAAYFAQWMETQSTRVEPRRVQRICEELAAAMFRAGVASLPLGAHPDAPVVLVLARPALKLAHDGAIEFAHAAFQEYFVATRLAEEARSFGAASPDAATVAQLMPSWNAELLNDRSSVLRFVADLEREHGVPLADSSLLRVLREVVLASRNAPAIWRAAANAAMVLNAAGVSFASLDLRLINLGPSSDESSGRGRGARDAGAAAAADERCVLNGAVLERADLTGATLTGVDLRGASLDGVNLSRCALRSLELGGRSVLLQDAPVWALAWPTPERLVTGAANGLAAVWSPGSAQQVLAFSKHTGAVTTLACSADGRYAATAGADKSVRVWRMGTGAEEAALVGHAAAVSCVAFRPDGRELISCSTDGTVRVWALAADGSRWEEEQRLDMSPATPTALAWSPRATLVAIGCSDKSVVLIQADSWRQMARLLGHRGPVNTMAFSDDEGLLASGGADTTVHVWSVKAARAFKVLDGHTDSVTGVAWQRAGGGRAVLATSSMDRTVRVWAVDSGLQLAEESMRDGATGVCWSPDGAWLAASCADCATRLWRWSRVGLPQRVRWERAHLGGVTALACHRDGLRVAVASSDCTVSVWSMRTLQQTRLLRGHSHAVSALLWSPDGTRLFSGSFDRSVRVWIVRDGREVASFHGHTGWVRCLALSPDGATLASGSEDMTVRLWSVANVKAARAIGVHSGPITQVSWDARGEHVFSASLDGTVQVWSIAAARVVHTLKHGVPVRCLTTIVAGAFVATGAEDGCVRLWASGSLKEDATLQRRGGAVTALYWSERFSLLASGYADGSVRLWGARGDELGLVARLGASVSAVGITPEQGRLVCGSTDGELTVWDVESFVRSRDASTVRLLMRCGGRTSGRGVVFSQDEAVSPSLRLALAQLAAGVV